jgi:hypothetical protein
MKAKVEARGSMAVMVMVTATVTVWENGRGGKAGVWGDRNHW